MQVVAVENAGTVLAACPNVVAAWAFGSAKDGSVRPGSDLDIGVLFRSKPGLDELTDLLLALQQTFDFEKIDLSVLNDASSVLRFEAVSGRPLYCRDAGQRAIFVSLAARQYEDDMAFFERGLRWRAEAYGMNANPESAWP